MLINRRKRSNRLSGVKPPEKIGKNPQSFLGIDPVQDHACEYENLLELTYPSMPFSKGFLENDVENVSKEESSNDGKDRRINYAVCCRYGLLLCRPPANIHTAEKYLKY